MARSQKVTSMNNLYDNDKSLAELPEKGVTRREFLKKTAVGAGAVAATIIVGGCSSQKAGSISADQDTGAISARLDWGLASKSALKTVALAPAGVTYVRLIVSGAGISPALQKDFPATAGTGTIDGVPAGTGRTLTAQGLDASGAVTYQGTAANITVQAGQTTNTGTITMAASSNSVQLGSFSGNIVLGSPTKSSMKVNIFSPDQGGIVYLAYSTTTGFYDKQTSKVALVAGSPLEIMIDGLAADTHYFYRLYYEAPVGAGSGPTVEYAFHTARPAGSTFTFCIQGDSHPERVNNQFNSDLYARTLQTAAADKPDFYMTIGDDFSVDQLNPATITAAQVIERYTIQRPFLGIIGNCAPVFLENGNHEQAARYLLDGTPNNVAVWAQNARNSLYSQPAPDGFYSGNTEQINYIGLLRNYFAWTWGDALFVVIDPYWESSVCVDNPFNGGSKRSNLWDVTHGDAQYQWLKTSLEQSTAKFKFVFAHHVMGTGRGGIELANLYEWGGQNSNGTSGFSANRPNWPAPIHQLMAANKVTIFFQGHDHIWARQQIDGVTYQTLSEPADPFYTLYNNDAYLSGDKLPNTGYTRVTVSPSSVKVDYVRTYLPADEGQGKVSGSVAFSYSLSSSV